MKKKIVKILKVLRLAIIIILAGVLFLYCLKFIVGKYIETNHNIIIQTNISYGIFPFTKSCDRNYLVNSSLRLKTQKKEFDSNFQKISDRQLKQLQEIEKKDNQFKIDYDEIDTDFLNYRFFFYKNFIFYAKDTNWGDKVDVFSEEWIDLQENIYKYSIDSKKIEKIKTEISSNQRNIMPIDIKLEALMHIYPKLKGAILKKANIKNDLQKLNNDYSKVFYSNDRIFFSTEPSSSKNKKYYLYEYINVTNKIKKITFTKEKIVDVYVVK